MNPWEKSFKLYLSNTVALFGTLSEAVKLPVPIQFIIDAQKDNSSSVCMSMIKTASTFFPVYFLGKPKYTVYAGGRSD